MGMETEETRSVWLCMCMNVTCTQTANETLCSTVSCDIDPQDIELSGCPSSPTGAGGRSSGTSETRGVSSCGGWRTRRTCTCRDGCSRHDAPESATTSPPPGVPTIERRSSECDDDKSLIFCGAVDADAEVSPGVSDSSDGPPPTTSMSSSSAAFLSFTTRTSSARTFLRRRPCSVTSSLRGAGTVT